MNIRELQKWTQDFDKAINSPAGMHKVYPITNHMHSEMGEVSECINRLMGWKDKPETVEHLAEEIADVIILAFKLASCFDIDMEEAIQSVIKKLEKRWDLGVDKY